MIERVIRPLLEADIERLREIDLGAHGTAWSRRVFLDDIELEGRHHLVAEENGQIVGHAATWIDGTTCRVTNVAVASDARGHGHGAALLLAVLARSLDGSVVTDMRLEVRPGNRHAQRLYGTFGFVPVGVERDFYDRANGASNRDAVVMQVADVSSRQWRDRFGAIDARYETGATR